MIDYEMIEKVEGEARVYHIHAHRCMYIYLYTVHIGTCMRAGAQTHLRTHFDALS